MSAAMAQWILGALYAILIVLFAIFIELAVIIKRRAL